MQKLQVYPLQSRIRGLLLLRCILSYTVHPIRLRHYQQISKYMTPTISVVILMDYEFSLHATAASHVVFATGKLLMITLRAVNAKRTFIKNVGSKLRTTLIPMTNSTA